MDPRLVGKGVLADHRLVGLDQHSRQVGEQMAGLVDFLRLNSGAETQVLPAHSKSHHDLLQGGVAGPLANSVDGAFHLAGSGSNGGQGVGYGQPQVVVAMAAQAGPADIGHLFPQDAEDPSELVRHAIPHRVGDVDDGRSFADGRLDNLAEIIQVAAPRVLRGKLHLVAEGPGQPDRLHRVLQDLIPGTFELELQVDIGGGDEGVDSRLGGNIQRLPAPADILFHGPGQSGHRHRTDLPGNLADRLEIAVRGDGKPGFHDIHPERLQLVGQLQLLLQVHAAPG